MKKTTPHAARLTGACASTHLGMTQRVSTLIRCGLRLGAAAGLAAVLGGCASTITSVFLPSNVAWRTISTTVITPYKALSATATGADISATVTPLSNGGVLCNSSLGKFTAGDQTSPDTWNAAYQLSLCQSNQPSGATNVSVLGIFYPFTLSVTMGNAFVSGGGEVSSDVGNIYAVSLTKNSLGKIGMAAGVSPVVFGGQFASSTDRLLIQYGTLVLNPPEPSFGPMARCADGTLVAGGSPTCASGPVSVGGGFVPTLMCATLAPGSQFPSGDLIAFYTGAPQNASITCGAVPISITMNSTYRSLGECVDTNIKQYCTGLTGKNRAACNQTQAGACQDTFNVPSALNPNK